MTITCINCGYIALDADPAKPFFCNCGWTHDPTAPTLFKFNAVNLEETKNVW